MKPPNEKRPHKAGADLSLAARDLGQKYSETGEGARPRLSLAYVRPAWRDQIWVPNHLQKRKPKVSWHGNVARVRIKPVGFRIIEVEPDVWQVVVWCGAKGSRACTEAGPKALVEEALAWVLTHRQRPVYPPLSLVGRNCRLGGARNG